MIYNRNHLTERIEEIGKSYLKTLFYERPQKPKPSKVRKTIRAFLRTLAGRNKTGEAIHGVLDLLPIPNQALAKIFSYWVAGDRREAKEELSKLLTFRNIVALLLSIAFISGIITIEDLRAILELI